MAQNKHRQNESIAKVMSVKAYDIDTRQCSSHEEFSVGIKKAVQDLAARTTLGDKLKIMRNTGEREDPFDFINCTVTAMFKNVCLLEYQKNGRKFRLCPNWTTLYMLTRRKDG